MKQFCIIIAAILACISIHAAEIPSVAIPACRMPPLIDGGLTDDCWRDAAEIKHWFIVGEDGPVGETNSHQAWVAMDAQWLYVAFKVAHPYAGSIAPQVEQRDGRVQFEDCVKVLFDPGTGFNPWYHFRLSAGNVQSDQKNSIVASSDTAWDIPWRSAAKITDAGWQAEIALPFALMLDAGSLDLARARLNLMVHCVIPLYDQMHVKVDEKRVMFSWAPVRRRFWSDPDKFGRILNLAGHEFNAPFLPGFRNARVGAYYQAAGQSFYDVELELFTRTSPSGRVELAVIDQPAGGIPREHKRLSDLQGDAIMPVKMPVPVAAMGKRAVRVAMRQPGGREVWQSDKIVNTDALNIFEAYLDRSYYTDESSAFAIAQINLPADILPGMVLRALDEKGGELSAMQNPGVRAKLAIPLNLLPEGRHKITLDLRDNQGRCIAGQELTCVRRPPRPGCEIKIDLERLCILKNNAPFFPMGLWGVINDKPYMAAMAEAGMNAIIPSPNADEPAWIEKLLETAAGQAIQVVVRPDKFDRMTPVPDAANVLGAELFEKIKRQPEFRYDPTNNVLWGIPSKELILRPELSGTAGLGSQKATWLFTETVRGNLPVYREVARHAMRHENLLAYFIYDEPIIPLLGQDVAGQLAQATLNETDGYHPLLYVYGGSVPDVPQATSFLDILCVDCYLSTGGGSNYGMQWLAKETALINRRCHAEKKVFWLLLMGERLYMTHKRFILPSEQRCQTYLGLINGARGMFYFNAPVFTGLMWDTLSRLAREIQVLAPALMRDAASGAIEYTPGEFDIGKGIVPDVLMNFFRYPDGRCLLLAVNIANYPVTASFTSQSLADVAAVDRLLEDGQMAVADGRLTEKLAPLATRMYVWRESAPSGNARPDWRVEMTPHPEQALTEAPLFARFTGKKNMIANPSFEDSTFPGWPDYYIPVRYGRAEMEKRYLLDDTQRMHGKQSLKIMAPQGDYAGLAISQGEYVDPYNGDPEIDYLFSIWIKADRPGVKFQIKSGKLAETVMLSADWKRYSWRIRMPTRIWFSVTPHEGEAAAVWLDALQLEKSEEPTEFEP